MKDRVPLYPGRVTLTPVSGQANTYDMVRADQPTEEGTPLNKENLLSDETAAALGLSGDPTVDDAFGALDQSIKDQTKIGDIKITTRTDLGDKWLLCNGERLKDAQYQDLIDALNNPPKDFEEKEPLKSHYYRGLVSNGNGTFVARAVIDEKAAIVYSTDNGNTWQERTISSLGSFTVIGQENDVASGVYTNGYYVFPFYRNPYNSNREVYIAYATSPTEDFTFVKLLDFSTIQASSYYEVHGIAYGNGYWCVLVVYKSQNSFSIYTSTSLDGPWTVNSSANPGGGRISSGNLFFEEGRFVFSATETSSNYPSIFYTENPASTWNRKRLSSDTSRYLWGFSYLNGYYVAYYSSDSIFYTNDIDGFTSGSCPKLDLDSDDTPDGISNFPMAMVYGDGYYAMSGQAKNSSNNRITGTISLYVSKDISGPYTLYTTDLSSEYPTTNMSIIDIIYSNGVYALVFLEDRYLYWDSGIAVGIGGMLPTIPVEDAYAYIKAKE